MPVVPRTKKGHRTRERLLEAAGGIFSQVGYIDARMSDFAQAAGLSTGGLYRYFDNKTDVFAALIADLHEEFYELSGNTEASLADDPLAALTQANRGYIEHYHKNRHVMRAFIEAASMEERFRLILREMRERHVKRFAEAYRRAYGDGPVAGVPVEVAGEAMACMVEQCCLAWFAQEQDAATSVSVDEAVAVTSHAWFVTMFAGRQPLAH
jgi:AcrR family transcriptional regulator